MEPTMSPIDATGVCAAAPLPPPADFPVIWQNPDDACLCWTLDRVHWPDPMAPLVFAIAGEASSDAAGPQGTLLSGIPGQVWPTPLDHD